MKTITSDSRKSVIPAKAGIQAVKLLLKDLFKTWIPAFAGMTNRILLVRNDILFRLAIALLIFFALSPVPRVHAEATKETYFDFGFYDNNGTEPFTVGTFKFSIIEQDFERIPSPSQPPPEGKKISSTTLNMQWGGWYVLNTTGYGNGVFQLRNYSDYSGGSLRLWILSNENITVNIEHGNPMVSNAFTIPSTNGVWKEQVIPFSSFTGGGGIDFTQIRTPFVISRTNPNNNSCTWLVDHVRWTKPLTGMAIFPVTTQVNPNAHRQFTVEGRNSSGDEVVIYSTFSASGSVGSFNPGVPTKVRASTFTAATTDGNATAVEANVSTSAIVDNTNENLNGEFGLLSETISGIQLDVDSKLLVAFGGGGGAQAPEILDETSSDVREGVKRFRTTIFAQSDGASYSGWYIQWDTDPNDTLIRDMNTFYDGSIRFWFKGPSALLDNVEIGIRSGNVIPGREYSKVKLKNYVTFDDEWHSVVVPIKALAGAKPWADISRTKILVSVFTVGVVNGDQTFYIDNLRWDTRQPGPLVSLSVSPNPANIPLSAKRLFTATGFDANGATVDVFPSWSVTGGIGSLSTTEGVTTQLTASDTPASGTITATEGSISSSSVVNVADPVWTQSYNVYSDIGSGGYVGVAVNPQSDMDLSEENLGGGAPEGTNVRRALYTLNNETDQNDAYAIWFTNYDAGNGSRFMGFYEEGYLSFWIKTDQDLQISIRSANIPPGTELSKIRLSEYGVPLDDTFQKIVIPLSDFKAREPLLDFNQIQTYFAIGALSEQIGEVTNEQFDVDDVKWLTAASGAPNEENVYIGLQEKQNASGLVRSFDTLPQAVTYDQALAAMNFTYRLDLQRARDVFDIYQTKFNGGYSGFHDEYDVGDPSIILDSDRLAGPNAWVLLSLIHYRNVSGDTQYDAMIDGIADWLLDLQDSDGAIKFGYVGNVLQNNKSTEHAFDCYAVFQAYAAMRNNSSYTTAANNIWNWLKNEAYVSSEKRFNVGEYSNGSPNPDKALDVYSWAPLALSSYTAVLASAVLDLGTTQVCDLTGVPVTGFDFSGPVGQQPDKDAVWIEGTGQMALAYYATEDLASGDFYINELEKAIVVTSQNGQGMPYATNNGTAYGFNMDSLHPCVSAAAWYLFAKKKFNPFEPFPLAGLQIRNNSNDTAVSSVTWSAVVPTRWVVASQHVRLEAQPISIAAWGVQIYTDNTDSDSIPKYIDPTPGNTINPDSDPAGLIWYTGASTSSIKLPLAWRIQDAKDPIPSAIAPYTLIDGGSGEAFNWFFFKDQASPAIDLNGNGLVGDPEDGTIFTNGEDFITIRKPEGIHSSQGSDGYVPSLSPDYLFFEADHGTAAAQQNYRTNKLTFEFFLQ